MTRGLMLAWLAAGAVWAAEPPLPRWKAGERETLEKDGWVAGGLLLTYDPVEEAKREERKEPLDVEQPKEGELAEEETPPDEIPEKYLQAYFGERPQQFLVDPQGLLGAKDAKDRLGFLNYHAGDSSIDLFVYVFGADQEIPGAVRAEETIERFFSTGRPAAVVFYFLGAPQRSVLYLSPSLTEGISAAEQRRALQSSVMMAFEKLDPVEQMEAFSVQMSIRIYWMERMLGDGGTPVPALPAARTAETPEAESGPETKARLMDMAKRGALPAGVIAGAALAAAGMRWWLRSRARYRFPEFEVEPRLGAAHAAGVGAVISFASANLPPALQRDQVPDYLRRA